jgi:hypothetical protein
MDPTGTPAVTIMNPFCTIRRDSPLCSSRVDRTTVDRLLPVARQKIWSGNDKVGVAASRKLACQLVGQPYRSAAQISDGLSLSKAHLHL